MTRAVFNGIDFSTGDYLSPPTSTSELTRWILARRRDLKEERELLWAHERGSRNSQLPLDVDPLDLASSGWGAIIPKETPWAVKAALGPLLELRQQQAARKDEKHYRELDYIPSEQKDRFLRRHGVAPGPAHPDKLPYYLLIVGGPDVVPFRFQYQLDVQYAVGRLAFDDAEGYRNYAESVVAAEMGKSNVRPEISFSSVQTTGDQSTDISTHRLVKPLIDILGDERPEWKLRSLVGEEASKDALRRLLGYGETPALLLTAAHGLTFRSDHPWQRKRQGAILCQDWPGRKKRVWPEQYFAAGDLDDHARVHGLVAVLFGCHSAGTSDENNFPPGRWGQPRQPPAKPFVSEFARRLLSHPNGSALAVIGHIDRVWTSSFGGDFDQQILHVGSLFKQLLDGFPVGLAMQWMNERFAEMSTDLTNMLNKYQQAMPIVSIEDSEQDRIAQLWGATNDARNFIVLGDPAVRLASGPQIRQTRVVAQRRARQRNLHLPLRLYWKSHVENWLDKVGSRDLLDLGLDPTEVVRVLRDREER